MSRLLNQEKFFDLLIILGATISITFLVWLPHIFALPSFFRLDFSAGFNTIYRNYDGIEYVVIAKSLYQPQKIASLPQTMPAIYYASHFPGYPLIILIFSPLLGFLKSMLFTSLFFTFLATAALYILLRDFQLTKHPLYLALLSLVLPARWLITHSVGSAEPMFIFFTILALYNFLKFEQTSKPFYIFLAGVAGALAQLTRPPGILLFIALSLYIFWKGFKDEKNNIVTIFKKYVTRYSLLLLIPLTLVGVFSLFYFTYGDFWAYFHTGDNRHLLFPPYLVFNKHDFWVGDIWLEDIVYIFLVGFLGGIMLLRHGPQPLGFFVLTYLAAATLVTHRDISRYTLPIFPFLSIPFAKILTSKEFKIALGIISLAIYLYAQNFLIENTAPYPNLELFN